MKEGFYIVIETMHYGDQGLVDNVSEALEILNCVTPV